MTGKRRGAAVPDERPAEDTAKRTWRLSPFSLLAGLLALVGMVVFAYPTVAGWISSPAGITNTAASAARNPARSSPTYSG